MKNNNNQSIDQSINQSLVYLNSW